MLCHVCGEPAIGQCRDCHQFHCGRHGRVHCVQCRVQEPLALVTAPFRQPEANEGPVRKEGTVGAVGPCARCGRPTARTCPLCGRPFCTEHRGWREVRIGRYNLRRAVCAACGAPGNPVGTGLFWLLALVALVAGGVVLYWLVEANW
jgi:hypothetical protein